MTNPVPKLRVVFMGTPAFSVPVFRGLHEAGHQVVGVYTQPDRQTGRGRKLSPSPVKQVALEQGVPVLQPASLRNDSSVIEELASLSPDVIIVAAYGLFLPPEFFELPTYGSLNVHPSLLPKYRGPAPVVTTILNGDDVAGVSIIRLIERMDAGPILAQRETRVGASETSEELTPRLFELGAELLIDILPDWAAGKIVEQPQDERKATTTHLLSREDGEIDWSNSADYISRQVRAYVPWPGTFTRWQGETLKIVSATAGEGQDAPMGNTGEVVALSDGVGVVTGAGLLRLSELQVAGRRAVAVSDFLLGHLDFVGSHLGL
ncbi:MAG: methionyl-tRNA formyltransferase [Chloroflexi bacterium]|nr:methionyl-tRNA formyltransferase [Chloroflexota bacterium]